MRVIFGFTVGVDKIVAIFGVGSGTLAWLQWMLDIMNKAKARVAMIRRLTTPDAWLCIVQIFGSIGALRIVRSRIFRIAIYANA